MNDQNWDDAVLLLVPEELKPLYGKGFDQEIPDEATDLLTYAYRVPVRTGRMPPITLAFEAQDNRVGPAVAFVVEGKISVHGTDVVVVDYESSHQPGFGSQRPVDVWTVYVDKVGA